MPSDTGYAGITITKNTTGVTFTKADGVTPGDPDNIEKGDIVIYGAYEYRYNYSWNGSKWSSQTTNGWGTVVLEEYKESSVLGELCGTIYGKAVKSTENAFRSCKNLTQSPLISVNVTKLSNAFYGCTNLSGTLQINSSIISDMSSCFQNVKSLAVKVPASSTTYDTITSAYGLSTNITIETFEPET